MRRAVTHGYVTTQKMIEPIAWLVWWWCRRDGCHRITRLNRDDSRRFSLACLPQTMTSLHPTPSNSLLCVHPYNIALRYPWPWLLVGDAALVSYLSCSKTLENVMFPWLTWCVTCPKLKWCIRRTSLHFNNSARLACQNFGSTLNLLKNLMS